MLRIWQPTRARFMGGKGVQRGNCLHRRFLLRRCGHDRLPHAAGGDDHCCSSARPRTQPLLPVHLERVHSRARLPGVVLLLTTMCIVSIIAACDRGIPTGALDPCNTVAAA